MHLQAELASVFRNIEGVITSHVNAKCDKYRGNLEAQHKTEYNELQDRMRMAQMQIDKLSSENHALKRKLGTIELNSPTASYKPNSDLDHRLLPNYSKSKVQRVTEREKHPCLIPIKSPLLGRASSPSHERTGFSSPSHSRIGIASPSHALAGISSPLTVARQIFPTASTSENNVVVASHSAEKSQNDPPNKVQSVTDSAQFVCTESGCGRQFSTKQGLQIHTRMHTRTTTSYLCPLCDNKYKRKADLDKHVRIHSAANKKLKCDQCGKMYSRQRDLDIHLRTHTATNQKYNCSKCHASFKSKSQYRLHENNCQH